MPEYLAPSVYVEEVDTGPRPIEGVSTSTAGFIGVTERGPVNVPILVTSPGEYANWFGGLLNRDDFVDPSDPERSHCYLPHAIQGFFTNGGKRAYVLRVVPDDANQARRFLYNRGAPGDANTVLLRTAREGTGTALAPPNLYVLDPTGIVALTTTVRIGDGSASEYILVANVTTGATDHIPLDRPVRLGHGSGALLHSYARVPKGGMGGAQTLANPVNAGANTIVVASPGHDLTTVAMPWLVELSANGTVDVAAVTNASPPGGPNYTLTLNQPLAQAYGATHTVTVLNVSTTPVTRNLNADAAGGDSILFAPPAGSPTNPSDIVEIEPGSATAYEVRTVGQLATLSLVQPANRPWPAKTVVAHVALTPAATPATTLTDPAAAGDRVISLASRVAINPGDVLQIGSLPGEEYVTVNAVTGVRGAPPDAGTVVLEQPLALEHVGTPAVQAQSPPGVPASPHLTARLVFDVPAGATNLVVTSGQGWAANDLVSITTPDGEVTYRRVAGPATAVTPAAVTLDAPLLRTHPTGAPVVGRETLFRVQALDQGAWGRRLRVAVADENPGLVSRAEVVSVAPPLQLKLTTLTGVEPGSYLELIDPITGSAIDPNTPLKVRSIDRANTTVRFDAALSAAQIGAIGLATTPIYARSREFSLTVLLYRQPDAAVPSRNEQILLTEVYRNLSMDHRHSRYIEKVIGATNAPLALADRRPQGNSMLIRVLDTATTAANMEAARLGPESLIDQLPGGLTRAARHQLDQDGTDSIGTITDQVYLGIDDPEPLSRTGLAALRNVSQISLVAIPGQSTPLINTQLIAHCENSHYRFAVLDPATAEASLADIQAQRQAFDTKYAALYYPWLTIPDPMPNNLDAVRQFALPPSGHVLGIYARVDNQRGVHKAPANETVLGITDLKRRLTKGEQDILNPSPVNINVIRDFRHDGRSIRVWGARCITSDSDYKYVPVRRLLIFIEQSIDLGLQWVVFEPNAPQLWGRVRRTVTNFLTDVWRSGALEGTKPEEGFFVRCDRTTMTQSDIDNGRLIILIGVAPVKPAEFVIIRIGLMTAGAEQ
jgi:phage tail sheath protein FI